MHKGGLADALSLNVKYLHNSQVIYMLSEYVTKMYLISAPHAKYDSGA